MNNSILKLAYNLNLRLYTKNLLVCRNKMTQEGKALKISQNTIHRENQESLSYQNFKEGLSLLNINQDQAKNSLLRVLEGESDIKYEEERIMAQSSLELAKIFIDEKNVKKAQRYLKDSLKWATKGSKEVKFLIADIYYHMGLCTLAKNKQSSAKNHFENYLEVAEDTREDEKNLVKKELSRILLEKCETKDVELMLWSALNYFKGQKNSVNCGLYEAECHQLLGEYYLIEKDYEKVFQSNMKCLTLIQKKKKSIEGFEKLYVNISKSFLFAGQKLIKKDEEKALVFLRHSLESFNKLGSEEMGENSWIQANILVSALDILSKRRDYAECQNIIRRLKSESFSRQDFQSDKSYRDFVLCLAQSQMRLELYEEAYKLIKSSSKYFVNIAGNKSLLMNYHYLWTRLAYENDNFEDALNKQKLITVENESSILFESYSISIKSLVKLQKLTEVSDVIQKWASLMNTVESKKLSEEITNLFSFFIENFEFKLCEAFLLEISQQKLKDCAVMRLVYTYLSILSSKKSDLVKAQVYIQMIQESALFGHFNNSFKKSSSSSADQLLTKMMRNSTIIRECQQELASIEYVNKLWSVCYKCMEESEVLTAHIILKEIRRLVKNQTSLENKLKLLEIVLEIEMGKLDDAANLLKDAVDGMEAFEYGDFTPLVYFLYGDTLKDLNSSGEAMIMWIKAVNTYMKMKGKKSVKIASKNALLFENLMSCRSDLLPQLYKETVERHFKC